MSERAMRPGWAEYHGMYGGSVRRLEAGGRFFHLNARCWDGGLWLAQSGSSGSNAFDEHGFQTEPAAQLAAENALRNILTAALDELGPAP